MKRNNKWELIALIVLILTAFYITVIFPLLVIYVSDNPIVAHAEDNPYGTLFKIESTAYCYGEITASGQAVHEGIAAGRKDWIGLTAILYTDENGEIGHWWG